MIIKIIRVWHDLKKRTPLRNTAIKGGHDNKNDQSSTQIDYRIPLWITAIKRVQFNMNSLKDTPPLIWAKRGASLSHINPCIPFLGLKSSFSLDVIALSEDPTEKIIVMASGSRNANLYVRWMDVGSQARLEATRYHPGDNLHNTPVGIDRSYYRCTHMKSYSKTSI